MDVIKQSVSKNLKQALQELDTNYFIKSSNNLINHRVFYCNKWKDDQNKVGSKILDLIKVECEHLKNTFENNTLIQINLINAPPDCNNQLFHLDYKGDSVSYFIPLVELSDLNGTEYLYFFEEKNYKIYYENLLYMSDNYLDKQDAINYLTNTLHLKINIDFVFKCANSDAFSLLYMPHYVYHRGQKNKTNKNRIMLNILFSIENKFDYPIEEYILDAEIDEAERSERILEIRKNKNIK
jgi:hypothetical protein